jgi:hypothetical protein
VLRLESFEANDPANAFYRRNGWLEVERYFDEEAGVGKIVFRKPVAGTRSTARQAGRLR